MGALGACLDRRQEGLDSVRNDFVLEGKRCAYEVVLEGIVQEAHLASPEKAEEGYLSCVSTPDV